MSLANRIKKFLHGFVNPARWSAWQARGALSAVTLTLLEQIHVIRFFPTAYSDVLGYTWYLLQVFTIFLLVGTPLAILLAYLENIIRTLVERVSIPALVTAAIGIGLSIVLVEFLVAFVGMGQSVQFPEQIADVRKTGALLGLALIVILASFFIYPGTKWILSFTPNLNRPAMAAASLAIVIALGAVFVADFVLYSIHLDYLSPLFGVMAQALIMIAFFCFSLTPQKRAARRGVAIISLVVLLLLPIGPWRDAHARYVLYNHTPIAGATATAFSALVDFDRDRTSSVWVGGTDCDDFDAVRSPLRRETPGDGIDQDCTGDDSSPYRHSFDNVTPLDAGCRLRLDRPSIVLITIEALRTEVLNPSVMPKLSNFSQFVTKFNRAYTASTFTNSSLLSLFTSEAVSDLTGANPLQDKLYCVSPTFTKGLNAAGYTTAYYCRVGVISSLFREFQEHNPYRLPIDPPSAAGLFGKDATLMSAHLTNTAIDFVKDRKDPFFLWMHYTDTHAPYNGPVPAVPVLERPLTEYEQTAMYTDYHVGRFLDFLTESGASKNTIVIVTADHAEELGQHGRQGHGPNAYESAIHIPFLIWIPGCPPRITDNPISLRQLGPTLLRFAGQETTGLKLMLNSDPPLPVISEVVVRSHVFSKLIRAVIQGPHKLLIDQRFGGRMLFNLEKDPMETINIYRARPEEADRMEEAYRRWLDRADSGWKRGCTPDFERVSHNPIGFGGTLISNSVYGE